MADPGFMSWDRQPPVVEAPTYDYDFAKFSQKLHEI